MNRTELAADASAAAGLSTTLRQIKFLHAIPAATLDAVVHRGSLLRLAAGDILIREGDNDASELYLLLEGSLLVNSGQRHISRINSPGEIIGELAVLQSPPRTADVIAETAARVFAIRAEVLGDPAFGDFAAVFYQMLSYSLANKLRALTLQTRQRLDHVEHEAATDSLTGLANRKRLDEVLQTLAGTRSGLSFSVIMADVDHFKHYNDTHGHPQGDRVLTRLAGLLQSNIRRGDIAARYGGEEFMVVLPNCELPDARAMAGKLRAAVENEPFPREDTQPGGRLTITLGVAGIKPDETVAQLLQRVDRALYRGKAAGRNVVVAAE